jgi:hypothetical protein
MNSLMNNIFFMDRCVTLQVIAAVSGQSIQKICNSIASSMFDLTLLNNVAHTKEGKTFIFEKVHVYQNKNVD